MITRLLAVLAMLPALVLAAQAEPEAKNEAPKTVVFPFELNVPALHPDDLMFGTTVSEADAERVKVVTAELRRQLTQSNLYDVVDLSSIEAEIEEAMPIGDCNGCDVDLAKKVGGQIAVLPSLQKSSDVLLNMTIAVKDVTRDRLIKSEMVVIQGNTDESWLRGVRWLLKRKFDVKPATEVSN